MNAFDIPHKRAKVIHHDRLTGLREMHYKSNLVCSDARKLAVPQFVGTLNGVMCVYKQQQ